MIYTANPCLIWVKRGRKMQYYKKTIPTLRQEKKEVGTRRHGNLLNAEGVQGPLKQRSDFIEAKQTCKRLYDEHTAVTEVETTYPSGGTSRQRRMNSLKDLKNTHIDLMLLQDGDTILLPQRSRLHLRQHDGNQAATCGQRGNGTRGNLDG